MQQQTLLSFRTGETAVSPAFSICPMGKNGKGPKEKKGPAFFKKGHYIPGKRLFPSKVLARECLLVPRIVPVCRYRYILQKQPKPVTATAKNNVRERFPRLARSSRRKIKEIAEILQTGHTKTFSKWFFSVLQMTPRTKRHNSPQIKTRFHCSKKMLLSKKIVQAQCFPYTCTVGTLQQQEKRNSKQQKEQRPPKTFPLLPPCIGYPSSFFSFLFFASLFFAVPFLPLLMAAAAAAEAKTERLFPSYKKKEREKDA